MKTIQIRWQRLVDVQGKTCERCGVTETSVANALEMLKESVKGLGIDVVLEKSTLDTATFKETPLESNRIWIAGKPLEEWLSATISESQCGTACGDSNCRTMVVDGKAYEAVPPELIVKAGLIASAQLLKAEPQCGECTSTGFKPQSVKKWFPSLSGCGCGS